MIDVHEETVLHEIRRCCQDFFDGMSIHALRRSKFRIDGEQ